MHENKPTELFVDTLNGSLEESFAGFTRRHAVVVSRRHIPTYKAQPFGQRAQGVLAAPRSVSSGALLGSFAGLVFEMTAQSWRVERRRVTLGTVPSGSAASALRGIRGSPAGAGPTPPTALRTARFGLYVNV